MIMEVVAMFISAVAMFYVSKDCRLWLFITVCIILAEPAYLD